MFSRLCSLRKSLEHRVRAIVLHHPASVKRRKRGAFCGAFDGSQPRASQMAVTQKILQEEAPTLTRSPFRHGLSPDGPPSHWTQFCSLGSYKLFFYKICLQIFEGSHHLSFILLQTKHSWPLNQTLPHPLVTHVSS